ncbi:MAG TPA: amidohydrolase [Parvularculaceae bacterium]|nr:amidohydrolase [Parvularculaceae bacterium]
MKFSALFRSAAVAAIIAAGACAENAPGAGAAPSTADTVLKNGHIYTIAEGSPWAEAVAIKGGKFVAVGSNADMEKWVGEGTVVEDLGGKFAMPGIIDEHSHPYVAGDEALYQCQIPFTASFDELVSIIAGCAAASSGDDWIVASAWGSHLLATFSVDGALAEIDAVTAGHPLIMRDDTAHNAFANSAALAKAGITKESEAPEQGEFVKDPKSGELTGLLLELASRVGWVAVPAHTPEEDAAAAKHAVEILNGFGVTTFLDAAAAPRIASAYKLLDTEGGLTARAGVAMNEGVINVYADESIEQIVARRDDFRSENVMPDYVKFFLDGVPTSWTSAFVEPYLPTEAYGADFHGEMHHSLEHLSELVTLFDKMGLTIKIHAAADASVNRALDAIEAARTANGDTGKYHQIAHAGYIVDSDLPRFKKLRAVVDACPILWFPSPIIDAIAYTIGRERAEHYWPFRTLIDDGAVIAYGSDWPAATPVPNPWLGIEAMVTRKDPLAQTPGALWPEQAISLEETLKIFTMGGATAMNIADVTGSIEAGKSADMIVLDRNPFEIPADDISDVVVLDTIYKGKTVHQAE